MTPTTNEGYSTCMGREVTMNYDLDRQSGLMRLGAFR